MKVSWSLTPLAWAGFIGLIAYWGVIAAESYGIDALSAPLGLFGNVAYFLFFFPVILGVVVGGTVGWRAWKLRRLEATAGVGSLLLLLSFPMMLAMTFCILWTKQG